MGNPMAGQIAYLLTNLFIVGELSMTTFRWGMGDQYDTHWTAATTADTGNTVFSATNWLKNLDMIARYGSLTLFGIPLITQILSTAGIAADVNVMVWSYVLGLGLLLFNVVWQGLLAWQWNAMRAGRGNADPTIAGLAEGTLSYYRMMWTNSATRQAIAFAVFYAYFNDWSMAQEELIAAAASGEENMEGEEEAAAEAETEDVVM